MATGSVPARRCQPPPACRWTDLPRRDRELVFVVLGVRNRLVHPATRRRRGPLDRMLTRSQRRNEQEETFIDGGAQEKLWSVARSKEKDVLFGQLNIEQDRFFEEATLSETSYYSY
jgi:hypothetical protein